MRILIWQYKQELFKLQQEQSRRGDNIAPTPSTDPSTFEEEKEDIVASLLKVLERIPLTIVGAL